LSLHADNAGEADDVLVYTLSAALPELQAVSVSFERVSCTSTLKSILSNEDGCCIALGGGSVEKMFVAGRNGHAALRSHKNRTYKRPGLSHHFNVTSRDPECGIQHVELQSR
jgi:hypothetical protein